MTNSKPSAFRERSDDDFISDDSHPDHSEWLDRQETEERKRDEAGDDALQGALGGLAELAAPTNLEKLLFGEK